MKGQVPTVQFIMFLTISFSIFIALVSLFKIRIEKTEFQLSKYDTELNTNIVVGYVSTMLDSEFSSGWIISEVPQKQGKLFFGLQGQDNGIRCYVVGKDVEYVNSIFNFNQTIELRGKVEASKKIKLLWDRKNNFIEILKG
ncbi:MAG: hypothetical protein J7K98_03540 [Candidatus Aenigmarchaeota archaeon]|nr:hypothetical protein [Candidatus Aenigmarchaeota archaeon]